MFLDKFSTAGIIPKTRGNLANVKQRDDESLLSYLDRFKKVYDDIEGLSEDTVLTCFEGGFRSAALYTELQLRKPRTLGEMFNMARKVALAENNTSAEKKVAGAKKESTSYDKIKSLAVHNDRRGKNRTRKTETFTPLNVPKEDLVSVLKEKYGVPDPEPMHPRSQNFRDKTKYCLFHRDHGHLTEHCIQLKRAIEKLIQEGRLGEYKAQGASKESDKGKEMVIEVITTEVPSLTQ